MTIHFIDVGQGDAAFIDYGEYEILIDGGNKKSGRSVADYIKPYVDGEFELIVATHPDSDHIGGLIDVINDNSVVSILRHGEVSILFAVDMEAKQEKDLMGVLPKVNVLKASHHGSRYSSHADFLSVTNPEYIIISAGRENSYGHPHESALKRYYNTGAVVYGTFKSGTIVMTSDGKTYSFDTNNVVTLEDAGDH